MRLEESKNSRGLVAGKWTSNLNMRFGGRSINANGAFISRGGEYHSEI